MKKIQQYILEAITAAFLLLFLFWTIGYFANALWGMKFEIRSCVDGFTTLGGAGVRAMVKYIMDSWKNSSEGEKPYDIAGAVKQDPERDARSVGISDGVPETGMDERIHRSDEPNGPRV